MKAADFWNWIELVNRDALERGDQQTAAQKLEDRLAGQPVIEIKSFYEQLAEALFKLDTSKHFAACEEATDDGFLYARCYVVGMGKNFFQQVLKNPQQMPSTERSFELLLYVAEQAWARNTGKGEEGWDFLPRKDFETGSNSKGWPQSSGSFSLISFRETVELVRALRQANPSDLSSLALKCNQIADDYVDQLWKLGFTTPGYGSMLISLNNELSHGEIRSTEDTVFKTAVHFEAGVDPRRYSEASAGQRREIVVEIISAALKALANRDNLDVDKIDAARAMMSTAGSR